MMFKGERLYLANSLKQIAHHILELTITSIIRISPESCYNTDIPLILTKRLLTSVSKASSRISMKITGDIACQSA
ncbi:hypothetical protein GDO78_001593 [Eleutherodactylus coqui]|uniref:Uncharacterized protein n=1 Tax=Eleutherodactylus coqui TaxID=57060 RepID=A0A8J6FTU6_ELECQ|nr:hypothetical protein GDO78_001593 [Eleutherodactylus coqui]